MADSLSIAANAFAVVGIADIVFRTGKEVYELYDRSRNAPASVGELLAEMRASTSVIVHTRIFLQEFETSTFALEDGQSLPQIKTILTLFGHEFDILGRIIKEAQCSPTDGWLERLSKNFKWAWDDQRISQSCHRLQRLTTSMTAALSVAGRRNDVVMRQEMTATRADIVRLAEVTQKMEEHVKGILISEAPSSGSRSALVLSKQSNLARRRTRRKRAKVSDQDRPISQSAETDSENITQDTSFSPMADVTARHLEKVALWQHEDESITMLNPVYEDITMPLMLMKNALIATIQATAASGALILANSDISFVSQIIDRLLAFCHIHSASRLRSQTLQKAADPWMPTTVIGTLSPQTAMQTRQLSYNDASLCLVQETSKNMPWGLLQANLVLGGDRNLSEILCFHFTFAPASELSRIGISVSFISHRLSSRILSSVPSLIRHAGTGYIEDDEEGEEEDEPKD